MNALILANHDAGKGTLSDDTRQAFDNLWPLQFTAGDQAGAWAWLNFHLEPWESGDASYYGASLAAVAIGRAPGGYRSRPDIQDRLKLLRAYLQRGADAQHLLNRVVLLWASSQLTDVLTPEQRQAIIGAVFDKQGDDGGWSLSSLGPFKRIDGTPVETKSDGYASGVVAFALQRAGIPRTEPHVQRGLAWLAQNQDHTSGHWLASSLNKQRDPASDAARFMSDAATAFAVLALTEGR